MRYRIPVMISAGAPTPHAWCETQEEHDALKRAGYAYPSHTVPAVIRWVEVEFQDSAAPTDAEIRAAARAKAIELGYIKT
jgi:hypothetical protein